MNNCENILVAWLCRREGQTISNEIMKNRNPVVYGFWTRTLGSWPSVDIFWHTAQDLQYLWFLAKRNAQLSFAEFSFCPYVLSMSWAKCSTSALYFCGFKIWFLASVCCNHSIVHIIYFHTGNMWVSHTVWWRFRSVDKNSAVFHQPFIPSLRFEI